MKVETVMKHAASSCGPESTLAEAGRRMVDVGCGVLPVVTASGRVLGVLTDRDVCAAVVRRDVTPSAVLVRDAMTHDAQTVSRSEDLGVALARMRAHKVRRLPVTDAEGRLEGLLSLDDIVVQVPLDSGDGEDVLRTFRAVNEHPLPALTGRRTPADR